MVSNSEAVTHGIRIQVSSRFLDKQSRPEENQWLFAYTVRITNEGPRTVQLLSRHWVITDGNGRVEEVRGKGVVGEQPVIRPGESYEYTSGCPLGTPLGSMRGTYSLSWDDGQLFDAVIAPFALSEPYAIN